MEKIGRKSHSGFLRKSSLFILLNSVSVVWEVGFTGIAARLPEGQYATSLALIRLFFIVIAPVAAFQSVVSKEVASYTVLGEFGKRRYFVTRTFQLSTVLALVTMAAGLMLSPFIAARLRIGTVLPVILLFISIMAYFPIPAFLGVVQGLKRFYLLAVLQSLWGSLRLLAGFIVVIVLSQGLSPFMAGVAIATIVTSLVAGLPLRQVFSCPAKPVGRKEILQSFSLVIPVIVTLFCVTVMKSADVVFAKSFFSDSAADAYGCAALVGSGFFILSAVFLVMFPLVSEEKARGGDPIVFLVKSCLFVAVFSSIGIAVTIFIPRLPMYIVTLGKAISGAEGLIQRIGFAVVPVILINLMAQYFLAKNQWRFLPVLGAGLLMQLAAIMIFHATPTGMLNAIIAANALALLGMLLYTWHDHRLYLSSNNENSGVTD